MPQSRVDRDVFRNFDGEIDTLKEIVKFIQFNRDNQSASEGRKDDSKLVYDMYWGVRQPDILKVELRKRFPKTFNKRRLATENVTKAIVDTQSVVYKSPPQRVVGIDLPEDADDDTLEAADTTLSELQNVYDKAVRDMKQDFMMQKLERYQGFDQTSLVQIGYLPEQNRLSMLVLPQFYFDVILDEEGALMAVVKADYFGATREEELRTYEVWTKKDFWILDNNLAVMDNGLDNEDKNPYDPVIPFFFARASDPDQGDYCDPLTDLANLNTNINLLLTDAMHLAEFQIHGQPVSTDIEWPKDPKTGPETVLDLKSRGDKTGTFRFLTPNADFDGLFSTINRLLTGYASTRGLPPNMFSFEVNKQAGTSAASGVSLKIQNAPLIEFRQSQEEKYRMFEDGIFEIIRVVWNHNSSLHGLGEFPDDMKINMVYTDSSDAFETPSDRATTMLKMLSANLMKMTEIVMETHPSFNKKDAEKYLMEVLEEKRRFAGVNMGDIPDDAETQDSESSSVDLFRQAVSGINGVQPETS